MATESRWIPLESNPEVFNSWAKKAGLATSHAQFGDVYGLDEELLSMVPKPVKALILLFPDNPEAKAWKQEEDERIKKDGQPKVDGTIFWIKQEISNACGTIALIHALANSDVTLAPDSPLQNFIIQCHDKSPEERAALLASTKLFSSIHAQSASTGQTAVPSDLNTNLHFTCFVAAPEAEFREIAKGGASPKPDETQDNTGMRLIELDGRRPGPIDHGECKDLLSDVANLVKSRYLNQTASVYFSLMALAPPGN
ncbi:hypothetical protein BDQ12DRAFT_688634 [Crucibulum laeve]|uniref:Ubiquitin carboxyl-terminal hydrolase n=1 Tax=Crucibulum laeve TaxID=68775 RepID=A0A5C3LSY1_9AGAR|nr:hypothetical protein BDQ12DRAFT_688634 [Crucibulum laeve]